MSFKRLLPPIFTKTQKEVNKISKYFKKNNNRTLEKKDVAKSYARALLLLTSEILKIKKTFSKLQASKINNIYKIVSSSGKIRTNS